jgi:hypothetical protein
MIKSITRYIFSLLNYYCIGMNLVKVILGRFEVGPLRAKDRHTTPRVSAFYFYVYALTGQCIGRVQRTPCGGLLQSCRVGAAVRGTWRSLALLWHATIFSPGALSMPPLTGLAIATDVYAG